MYQKALEMKLSFVFSINDSGQFDLEASENKLAPSHVTVLLWNYPSTGATLKISKENGLDKDDYHFTNVLKHEVLFYFIILIFIPLSISNSKNQVSCLLHYIDFLLTFG